MFMNRFLINFILLFSCSPLFAQQLTVVQGKCRIGDQVMVLAYTFDDYISMQQRILGMAVAENGKYKLEFELLGTRQIFIQVSNTEGEMIAQEGKTYNVDIPAVLSNQQISFDKTKVELQFQEFPENDINIGIRNFNSDYRAFIDDHYYDFAVGEFKGSETFKSSMGEKNVATDIFRSGDQAKGFSDMKMPLGEFNSWVELFDLYVDSNYVQYMDDPYFFEYKNFKIAELEMISGVKPSFIYKENFFGRKVSYEQPGYFSLLRLLYGNLFAKVKDSDTKDWIRVAINVEKSPQTLEFAFKSDSLFFNEEIRTIVMIHALKENYYNQEFIKSSIETLLNKVATTDKRPEISKIAANTIRSLRSGRQGWEIPDFRLVDHKKDIWSSSELGDKYTYYIFYASWCSSCMKELLIIEKIALEYKDFVNVVAINMDDSFTEFEKYVKEHPNHKFTMLYGPSDPMIKTNFNLRALPTVVMVDHDQNIVFDHTRKPSEGVQNEFESLKIRATQKNKTGPKTWKD